MRVIKLLFIILCVTLLTLLFSCKTKQTVATKYIKIDSIVYSEKLTTKYDTIVTPPDSAAIKAYFECDSLGNVLIKELNEEKGRMKVRTIFKDNTIEVLVNVDSTEIIRQAEEQFKSRYNLNAELTGTVIEKTKSSDWKLFLIMGYILGGVTSVVFYLGAKKFKLL